MNSFICSLSSYWKEKEDQMAKKSLLKSSKNPKGEEKGSMIILFFYFIYFPTGNFLEVRQGQAPLNLKKTD